MNSNILVPETLEVFRKNFPEYEGLTDKQVADAARLFAIATYTLVSHPDALQAAMLGPNVLTAWLANVGVGAILGTWGRAGVLDIEKAAALVADIESKGDGEEGREHAKQLARGLWGK